MTKAKTIWSNGILRIYKAIKTIIFLNNYEQVISQHYNFTMINAVSLNLQSIETMTEVQEYGHLGMEPVGVVQGNKLNIVLAGPTCYFITS